MSEPAENVLGCQVPPEGNKLYFTFVSSPPVESNKTIVILCCIKLGMTIFMAFTFCCGIVIQV